MRTRVDGPHVVITGGGAGLGAAIAGAFASTGARLTLMGRSRTTITAQAGAIGRLADVRVETVVCDVADPASVARAFAEAVRGLGPVYALVNNAGHASASAFEDTTLASWQQMIDVNLTGTFLCTQQVLPAMIAAGAGRIINIASTAGLKGYARVAAYCAAKHGVVGLTRALAAETKRTGVTVNAVCPGYIEGTPMLDAAIASVVRATGQSEADARAHLARHSTTGTFVTMREVAEAVVSLCSVEAAATTGQTIVVAGGEALS